MEQAIFGAGDIQVLKQFFEAMPGVVKVVIGSAGGDMEDPTAAESDADAADHADAVLVEYDTNQISFEKICENFFIFPSATAIEFNWDEQPLIYCVSDDQRFIAEKIKRKVEEKMDTKLKVSIERAGPFYQTETI